MTILQTRLNQVQVWRQWKNPINFLDWNLETDSNRPLQFGRQRSASSRHPALRSAHNCGRLAPRARGPRTALGCRLCRARKDEGVRMPGMSMEPGPGCRPGPKRDGSIHHLTIVTGKARPVSGTAAWVTCYSGTGLAAAGCDPVSAACGPTPAIRERRCAPGPDAAATCVHASVTCATARGMRGNRA